MKDVIEWIAGLAAFLMLACMITYIAFGAIGVWDDEPVTPIYADEAR